MATAICDKKSDYNNIEKTVDTVECQSEQKRNGRARGLAILEFNTKATDNLFGG